jgi:3-keto-disaccharide hydrolase
MDEEHVMKTAMVLMTLVAFGATIVIHAASRKIDFSADAVGQPPKGFEFGHTAKAGAPGKWIVQAEGTNRYLAQVDADNTRVRFPVAVVSDINAADVDLSVRFKPVSGRVDQAAGLVWRFQNEDNYYIVRANALENNVVLYKVEKGTRTDLAVRGEGRTYGKTAQVPSGQWSTLRVVASGPRFEVYFNGSKLYEVEDTTFGQAGKVGVWTKADSVTQFDDLTITTR